jgi:hypothetical protein
LTNIATLNFLETQLCTLNPDKYQNKMAVYVRFSMVAWLLFLLIAGAFAQTTIQQKPIGFKGFSFDMSGDGKWEFDEGFGGKWVDEVRFTGAADLTEKWRVVAVDEMRFDDNRTSNNLTRVFIQYHNIFRFNKEKVLAPQSVSINLKAGLLEWYPALNDPRLVAENIDKYFNPQSFYGSSIQVRVPIDKKEILTAYLGAHTGDVLDASVKPALQDAYLMIKVPVVKNTQINAQVGKYQGSKHLVNFCYLQYKPTVELVTFDLRAGKLPALDQSPYGVHIGVIRPFKFIEIGGYYQRRLNMIGTKQIFGVTWRFLKPKKLVEVMNTYNFLYDSNTNTLRFIIPFIHLNVKI